MTESYKRMENKMLDEIGMLSREVVGQEDEIKRWKEDLQRLHNDKQDIIH
jgi:hypothetical protein